MESSTSLPNPPHYSPPTVGYFFGWWARTLLLAIAVGVAAPFAILATMFWLGIATDTLSGNDLQNLFFDLASYFRPVEWEMKILPMTLAASLAFGLIVVTWRTVRTRTAQRLGARFVRGVERPVRLVLRRAGFEKAACATEGDVFGWSVAALFVTAFFIFGLTAPRNPPAPSLTILPPSSPAPAGPAARAIVRTVDGSVIGGAAAIERHGGKWIVDFGDNAEQR